MREILTFLWPIIRPYRWHYVMMIQAPIIAAMFFPLNNYALKLVVDVFSKGEITYRMFLYPCLLFFGSTIIMEFSWRLSGFFWTRSQPFIRIKILTEAYNYVQYHSYEFFQSNHSGWIVSKIKGILDGYNSIWAGLHHRMTSQALNALGCIVAIAFVNFTVFVFVFVWAAVFFVIMLRISLKIKVLSAKTTEERHKAMGIVSDNITNIFTLFSFSSREREVKRIYSMLLNGAANADYIQNKYEVRMAVIGSLLYFAMYFVLFVTMIAMRVNGKITNGDLVFVISISFWLVESIWRCIYEVGNFIRDFGELKASFSILSKKQEVIDKIDAKELELTA